MAATKLKPSSEVYSFPTSEGTKLGRIIAHYPPGNPNCGSDGDVLMLTTFGILWVTDKRNLTQYAMPQWVKDGHSKPPVEEANIQETIDNVESTADARESDWGPITVNHDVGNCEVLFSAQTTNRLGSVAKELQSIFNVAFNQIGDLNRTVNAKTVLPPNYADRISHLQRRIDDIATVVSNFQRVVDRIANVEKRLDAQSIRIGEVERTLHKRMDGIEHYISESYDKRLDGIDESFKAHEKRIEALLGLFRDKEEELDRLKALHSVSTDALSKRIEALQHNTVPDTVKDSFDETTITYPAGCTEMVNAFINMMNSLSRRITKLEMGTGAKS